MPGGRLITEGGRARYTAEQSQLSVTVVQTGIGIENARSACREIFTTSGYDLAISSGFAGALIPSDIGAFVIPQTIRLGSPESSEQLQLSSFPCSVEYYQIASRIAQDSQSSLVTGLLLTVPWIVWSASEKRSLAQTFQACALDMESGGIADVANERGIPFIVIRTVSDLMDENLPEDFNLFLSTSTWIQGVWRFASRPGHWSQLVRLRRQTNVASQQLTKYFDSFFVYLRQQGTTQPTE